MTYIRHITVPPIIAERLWIGATTLGLWPTVQFPDWTTMRVR